MNSVILNFSNSFNLNDVESVIQSIDNSQLLFYNELSYIEHQDVIEDEACIRKRLIKFKNLLLQQSLTFEADSSKIRVINILSYDAWLFLGADTVFNCFPPFKIKYLFSAYNELFPDHKKKMDLYFIILAMPSKSFYPLFDTVENSDYSEQEDRQINWFLKKDFCFNSEKDKITFNTLNEDDNIQSVNVIGTHIRNIKENFFKIITDVFTSHKIDFLIEIINKDFLERIDTIKTVRDLKLFNFDEETLNVISNVFTYRKFINSGCTFFKIQLGESIAENIRSKVITASLIQILCTLEETDNVFREKKALLNFHSAKLSDENLNELFGCILGLKDSVNAQKKSIKSEITYTHYELNNVHASLTAEVSVAALRKTVKAPINSFRIPFFFNYNTIREFVISIKQSDFENIEKEVLEKKDFVLSKISKESLVGSVRKTTYESVRFDIEKMLLNPVKVSSTIDFAGYLKTRNDIYDRIEEEKRKLADNLMNLSKVKNILGFSFFSWLFMGLLYWPVFLKYNQPFILFALCFILGIVGISSIISFFILRKKIRKSINEILICYDDLLRNLNDYYKSIRKTAKELADAILYKANYEELTGIINNFNKENLMVDKWKSFFEDLIKNNIRISNVLKLKSSAADINFAKENLNTFYNIPRNVFSKMGNQSVKIKIENAEKKLNIQSFLKEISFITY